VKLSAVIEELVEERGLDKEQLSDIIRDGMLAAYQKKYPGLTLRTVYDPQSDEVAIQVEKRVVATVDDEDTQISVKRAHNIDKNLKTDDLLWVPFEGGIGRIEVLRARQVIASKIRSLEAAAVYNEFKEKESAIVHGVIHKCEFGGTVVKLDDSMGFLPKSLSIPGDKCVVGYPIKVLLKEVLPEPRHENQLILDRSSELFLQRLFELEIPEVFEKLVEIKKIVRVPGYKSKIAVISHDSNIDPVGTCVGVGGSRIKPILKELGGEKIDVVVWSANREAFVKDALKPAEIERVEMIDANTAQVWLAEDQRSLAIGKMGQNISLAAKLTGVAIQLAQRAEEEKKEMANESMSERDGQDGIENANQSTDSGDIQE
jgi:N utilization substance protein A